MQLSSALSNNDEEGKTKWPDLIQTLRSEELMGVALQVEKNRLQHHFKALSALFGNYQQAQKWRFVTASGSCAHHHCLLNHLTTPGERRRAAKSGSDSNLHTRHINKQPKLSCHLAGGASQNSVGFRRVRGVAGGCLLS